MKQIDAEKLIQVCLKLDDNYIKSKQKTLDVQRMAQLSREGQKDTEEFKILELKYKHPTVIDSSNEYVELHKLMKRFRAKR